MSLYKLWNLPDSPPTKPDCFLVLSYAVCDEKSPTIPTQTIIRLAYVWWKRYPKSKVIMSTGDNQGLGIPNSRVMVNFARQLGIPAKNLIEEDKSKDTYTNLIYSQRIVNKEKLKKVTLVLYDFHVRRSLAVAKKIGWNNLNWISTTSVGSPAYGIKRFQTFSRGSIFIYELIAYLYNKIRGEL
ncbi:YdcF family protein [Patescibacteria group bacterium]